MQSLPPHIRTTVPKSNWWPRHKWWGKIYLQLTGTTYLLIFFPSFLFIFPLFYPSLNFFSPASDYLFLNSSNMVFTCPKCYCFLFVGKQSFFFFPLVFSFFSFSFLFFSFSFFFLFFFFHFFKFFPQVPFQAYPPPPREGVKSNTYTLILYTKRTFWKQS
jgi:hypothetical protein